MHRALVGLVALAAVAVFGLRTAAAEPRIALVVGTAAYAPGPLKTPLADAGLVAAALNSVGFEIVEGADLGQSDLRVRIRDFLDKVQAAGPDALAVIYFAGYGLQFEGENYIVPVDARLDRATDIPLDAIRVSDLMRPLAGMPSRAKVLILDGAHPLPFTLTGAKLARGLGAMEAPPGMLVALSASPGMLAADDPAADYGSYAKALAEMLRAPGLDLGAVFMRARVRTHATTQGAQTPWHVSALTDPVVLIPGGPDAAAQDPTQPAEGPAPLVVSRNPRSMRDLGPDDGYALAIERDDLPTYVDYVQTYPRSPYARRIWAQIRARREALAWERAVRRDSPEAYWTYLRRYPDGVYAFDARRRLHRLSARDEPPPDFAPVEFADVPPPLADEPVEAYGAYEVGPPPPRLMGPPPRFFVDLPPPPPPRGPRLLPIPVPIPIAPRVNAPPPRVFTPPVGVLSPPGGPVPGAKPPGPAGVNAAPPGGGNPAGRNRPGAITTTTPPGAPAPRPPTPAGRPPGAVTTTSPPGDPPPRSLTPGARPPGAVTTTTPPGAPPPKPPAGPGAKPPGAVTTTAPAHVPPPRTPMQPAAKPPAAVTTTAPAAGPPPKPPGAPPVAAQPARQPPPAAAAKQPPPAPKRKCPIVNGVENCKGT